MTGHLKVSETISIVHLPPHSSELNPVERVWLHLKERYLSHHIFSNTTAITDA